MRLSSGRALAFACLACFLAGAHHEARVPGTLSQSCPLATFSVTVNTVTPFSLLGFCTQTKRPDMHPLGS